MPIARNFRSGGSSGNSGACPTNHGCQQECVLTPSGLPMCACEPGYLQDPQDDRACVDIDECEEGGRAECQHECKNMPGTYECRKCYVTYVSHHECCFTGTCPTGYEASGKTCVDVNECTRNNGHGPCQDVCRNEEGGYKCSCDNLPGTKSVGDRCEAEDFCEDNNGGCSHECYTTYGESFCMCPAGATIT